MGLALLTSPFASALPALQLGPAEAGNPDWSWNSTTQTWVLDGMGEVNAYAKSTGKTAWDAAGAADRYAYLVVAAIPQSGTDVFDVTVTNDGVELSLFASGFGNPPIEDPNSLASHGIYETWFEIYQFRFDGPLTTVGNVQPGSGDTTKPGWAETFSITLNSAAPGLESLHIDLFTVIGDGTWVVGGPSNPALVKSFAPFSHDAEMRVPTVYVSDRSAWLTAVLGFALLACAALERRKLVR